MNIQNIKCLEYLYPRQVICNALTQYTKYCKDI